MEQIFANVFATLLIDCRQQMIPMVNEVHGSNYTGEDEVVLSHEEHYLKNNEELEKRISDSHFSVKRKDELERYHFECQTKQDTSMPKRMAEYELPIALEHSEVEGNEVEVEFPKAAVLQLQNSRNMPDEYKIRIKTSEGIAVHKVRIMKLERYSVKDIFEKCLYLLILYHILVYKKQFIEYNKDEGKIVKLLKVYEEILARLEEAMEKGRIDGHAVYTIILMSRRIIEHVTAGYDRIRERLGEIMGGVVLDNPARAIFANGKNVGKAEGKIEGKIEGRIEAYISLLRDGIISMAEAAKRLGMNEEEVRQYL